MITMMNRRLRQLTFPKFFYQKKKNFPKVKEEQVGHFLQLAISAIYNNYTYILLCK